jgi:DNA-binding NarL/FixJ family response regulator
VPSVLICDDVAVDRESVHRAVAMIGGIDRVMTVASGEDALLRLHTEPADVVLMDVRMPGMGGVEAARRLHQAHPATAVIMLATAQDAEGVGLAVEAGARGYIAKDASHEEFAALLALVLESGSTAGRRVGPPRHHRPVLSAREQQVLEGITRGMSNAEIGRELFLAEDTVKTHARRLYRKMGATDRAGAVANGFRWGLLR